MLDHYTTGLSRFQVFVRFKVLGFRFEVLGVRVGAPDKLHLSFITLNNYIIIFFHCIYSMASMYLRDTDLHGPYLSLTLLILTTDYTDCTNFAPCSLFYLC